MYAVVEFVLDKSMAVVPVSWLKKNETVCVWPELRPSRLEKAVRCREELNPQWAVEEFACVVQYKTGE